MKDLGPFNTAFPADDDNLFTAPPPKPPATATVAGALTRLVDLPAFTPPEDDLLHLAYKAAMDDVHLCRLTPVMLEGVVALVTPYASDRQLQNCLLRYAGSPTPKMRARLGPVVVEMELVTPLTPRYVLQLEGACVQNLCIFAVEPGDCSIQMLISSSESAFLASAAVVAAHLNEGHLLLCGTKLLRPRKQTRMKLPPRPSPMPARAPEVMLTHEEADAVIAAVRLESPMPVVREGVRVRLNPSTNELETVGAGGRVKSVGWPSR